MEHVGLPGIFLLLCAQLSLTFFIKTEMNRSSEFRTLGDSTFWLSNFPGKLTNHLCSKVRYGRSRSSKVVNFDGNRNRLWDFTLVINNNIGPISHRFWDTVTYWLKINFPNTLSFNAFDRGDPFRISGKALRILTLESFSELTEKILWS